MHELIVVATHGDAWIDQCRASLEQHALGASIMYVDTGTTWNPKTDWTIDGGWPTGVLRWVYENFRSKYDRYLLMQDSMTALADPLPWFRDQFQGSGAVAWQLFPIEWDDAPQQQSVEERYQSRPPYGICGPIFYTDRDSLDAIHAANLMPKIPFDRWSSCASERAWAYAYAQLDMPVVGPVWDVGAMTSPTGVGPFRKTWANRS